MPCSLLPYCLISSLRIITDVQHVQQQLLKAGAWPLALVCTVILKHPANPWEFQNECGRGLKTRVQNRIALV